LQTNSKEEEKRLRIRIALAAYAYEFENDSLMSDEEFDALSLKIDVNVKTGWQQLDKFFKLNFEPSTGMWIRQHPQLSGLQIIYNKYFRSRDDL